MIFTTSFHAFTPLHLFFYLQPVFLKSGYRPGQFPQAERFARRILSLPLYPMLTASDQEDVIQALEKLVDRFKS